MGTATTATAMRPSRKSLPNRFASQARAHVVQFYDEDAFLVDAVSRFVGRAIGGGEAVIVVATKAHREGLEIGMAGRGVDLAVIRKTGRYVSLDAAEILSRFMISGHPEATRFFDVMSRYIDRAGENSKTQDGRVAVFGEMVTLLWARGEHEAAIQLEGLWNDLMAKKPSFHLRCAYPLAEFVARKTASRF
jgi:hypothetical protein